MICTQEELEYYAIILQQEESILLDIDLEDLEGDILPESFEEFTVFEI